MLYFFILYLWSKQLSRSQVISKGIDGLICHIVDVQFFAKTRGRYDPVLNNTIKSKVYV